MSEPIKPKPPFAVCNCCGRQTWMYTDLGTTCRICGGMFVIGMRGNQ